MRTLLIGALLLVASCSPAPPPLSGQGAPMASESPGYAQDIEQLTALNREAAAQLRKGSADKAADAITKAQAVMTRLLAVRHPTLAAMEAASDLDELYGRMLLDNRHYGWARMQFQKNVARWKNWAPQTPESERRRKLAETAIAECDRKMIQ